MIAAWSKQPFARPGLERRAAPFLVILALAFVLFLFESPRHWSYFAGSAAVAVLACTAAAVVPWWMLPRVASALPPLAVVLAIGLLREGQGGSVSGYGTLFLLPALWVACFGDRAQLGLVLAGVLAGFWLPIVLVGAPSYPTSQWRSGGFFVVLAALFGLVIQRLRNDVVAEEERRVDAERRLRETSAYELHDDVVQNLTVAKLALALGDDARARDAVAEALEVGKGIVETLLSAHEPEPGSFVRRGDDRET